MDTEESSDVEDNVPTDCESSTASVGLRSESSSPEIQNVSVVDHPVVTPVPNSPRLLPRCSKRQTRRPDRFDPSLYMFHRAERYPERVLQGVEAMKCVVKAILGGLDNK